MEERRKNRNQIRSKNKKKKIEEPPPISPAIDPSASFRNWSDLPEALLVSILRLLFSIPDLFAFAAVCCSWRSAAGAASSSSFRGPPLLLNPVVSPGRSNPARCRLQTLTGSNGAASSSSSVTLTPRKRGRIRRYRSMVPSKTLKRKCVGCSYGQLIFAPAARNAVLADAFTGRETQSPGFPDGYDDFSFGILTAPLASSPCFLLLVADRYPCRILCWAPGGSNKWSVLRYGSGYVSRIISLAVFKGHVFALTEFLDLIVVDLATTPSLKEVEITMPDVEASSKAVLVIAGPHVKYKCQASSDTQLVECGEELLLVPKPGTAGVGVYRLDLSKRRWVKMESLGDWCLFIDAVRQHAIACSDPTSWGGRNNCVYFARPGCDSWIVVPLDGEELRNTGNSPISVPNMKLSNWPSPVWVYPRFVRVGIQIDGRPAFSEPSKDEVLVQFLENTGKAGDVEQCVFAAEDRDDGDGASE